MMKLVRIALAASLLGMQAAPIAAQDEDPTPCEEACYVIEDSCFDACSNEDDPVECESTCTRNADDCARRCDD